MTTTQSAGTRVACGVTVLAVLGLHASYKLERGVLAEMLWACHVASLLIGVGLVARLRSLVALGTVFHLAAGFPAYVLDVIALGQTTPTSVLVHLTPPLAGVFFLKHEGPWSRRVPAAAVLLYVALIPLSRLTTAPELNVNLAFSPWPPLAGLAPWPWFTWLLNLGVLSVVVPVADRLLRRWLFPGLEAKQAHG